MRLFIFLLALTLNGALSAQDFNGQWKGSFNARGEGARIEYVLEINVNGSEVAGYSYTYPVFGGKKYYDICEIKGIINTKEKYIEVTEVGKIKSNVPPPYRFDCFQTHKLTYTRSSEVEKLSGPWEPANLSISVCGYGTTTLERRRLKDIIAVTKNKDTETVKTETPKKSEEKPKTAAKTNPAVVSKPKVSKPPVAVTKPKTNTPITKEVTKNKPELSLKKDTTAIVKKRTENKFEKIKTKPLPRFETRTNKVLETIEVEEEDIAVQLYDNGEIDGDTVTVTFNGDVVAYKKGLSAKPIILNLKVKAGVDNELVMYAENLGTVPPNTALMVVWVDDKRYTVTISSDEKRNGSIIFHRQN
ncbi:MAG: hypothetical protein ACM3H8_02050 [Sphingobacteriales bacterium]